MSAVSITVPLAGAKNKLSELVDRVSRGEEFVIMRYDTEIARWIPATRPSRKDVGDAIATMRATRPGRSATAAELQVLRRGGRR